MKNKAFIFVSIVLLCMLQYRLWCSSGGIVANIKLYANVNRQRMINQKLLSYNIRIANTVKEWKSNDLSIVEEYARHDLGMLKSGEVFYQVTDSEVL